MTGTTMRDSTLRTMLTERRRALRDDVQARIREGRSDRPTDVGDMVEYSDAATVSQPCDGPQTAFSPRNRTAAR